MRTRGRASLPEPVVAAEDTKNADAVVKVSQLDLPKKHVDRLPSKLSRLCTCPNAPSRAHRTLAAPPSLRIKAEN